MPIPNHLVDQPLEILKKHGLSFNSMSEEQKQEARWWSEHYASFPSSAYTKLSEARYIKQGFQKVEMTVITGKCSVWVK